MKVRTAPVKQAMAYRGYPLAAIKRKNVKDKKTPEMIEPKLFTEIPIITRKSVNAFTMLILVLSHL